MAFDDALAGVGGFWGSILGDILTGDERDARRRELEQERAMYAALPVELRAAQEQPIGLGPSAYESLEVDPVSRNAQLSALARLQGIGASQGLDQQSRAAMAESQAATASQERAQRGSILEEFARRGAGRGGNALQAALTAQQGSAQRAGMEGLRAAGDAESRQYRALLDSGSLAGAIRGQDYGQASDRARGMDAVSLWNAANRQAVNSRNAGATNAFTQGTADLAYRRAGLLGGSSQAERQRLYEEERRKRGLATGIGGGIGRNVGTGLDFYTGSG